MHMICRLNLIIFFSLCCLTACVQHEICDYDGAVYNMMLENYDEWLAYSAQNSDERGLTIEVGRFKRVVWFSESSYGTRLLISTWEGLGANKTFMGTEGYWYIPEGDGLSSDEVFEYHYMGNNIYCYYKRDVIRY